MECTPVKNSLENYSCTVTWRGIVTPSRKRRDVSAYINNPEVIIADSSEKQDEMAGLKNASRAFGKHDYAIEH